MNIRCKAHCPGANQCCCDGRIKHELHICSDEHCRCHTKERYDRNQTVAGETPECSDSADSGVDSSAGGSDGVSL